MPHQLEGFKIAQIKRINNTQMFWTIMVAGGMGIFVTFILMLDRFYRLGANIRVAWYAVNAFVREPFWRLAIQKDCVDCLNLGGSMVGFVKVVTIAEAAGLPVWHGSGVDLGIMDMSYVHACAAAKGCTMASDIIGNFLREDDLIVEPILFEDGCALVPQLPGLSVELDEAAVHRYAIE